MRERRSAGDYLIAAAALVIVIAGIREAQSLLVPLLLSAFFAVVLTPPLRWLERRRVPTVVALLLISAASLLAGVAVLGVMARTISEFSGKIDEYQAKLAVRVDQIEGRIDRFYDRVRDRIDQGLSRADDPPKAPLQPGDAASPGERRNVADGPPVQLDGTSSQDGPKEPPLSSHETHTDWLDPQWAMRIVKGVLSDVGRLLSNAAIIFVTVVFMLLEASRLPAKVAAALGGSGRAIEHVNRVLHNVRRYMAIKTMTSLLTGVLVAILAFVLRLDLPLLFGLLAFLFNFVPNVGSILAAIPAVALSLVDQGPWAALTVAAGYAAVNCFVSFVVEPRYMGKGLGLSALVVFLSLVFWGWVLGPVGMLLSAPLTMVVKIALEQSDETRWIGLLLSAKAPETGQA